MLNKYNHLFKTDYIPPSIIRQIEDAVPSNNSIYGRLNLDATNNFLSQTGQSNFDYILNKKLTNNDMYREMSNKIIFSNSLSVQDHLMYNFL